MPTFDDANHEESLKSLRDREEEELARMLADKYDIGYVDLTRRGINGDALKLLPEETARRGALAVYERVGNRISVAVKSPVPDATKAALHTLTERNFQPTLHLASTRSLERAWSRYKELAATSNTSTGLLDISPQAIEETLTSVKSRADVQKLITDMLGQSKTARISSILETVLAGALSLHASDVHVEPEEGHVRLRYRLDGVLTDITQFDRDTYQLLLSRIKLLSGLKLNIKNEAQDGRFSVTIRSEDIEVRSSALPGAYGEAIVMRILDPRTAGRSMEELGIPATLLPLIEREIRRPNGMILNTGPTGSGKTTTLYAFLRKIHTPDVKIVTIEDPIEYHLEGIVQTQVEPPAYTFESGLKNTLRQDPDVIMIGEIREREVAETAINAALTGHLVFSTLHTNTAAGAFPRLIDLGVDAQVIGSAVSIVLAQRLVRRLKPESRRPVTLQGAQREMVDRILASIPDPSLIPQNTTTIWEPKGEDENGELPYQGRIGVFEAIVVDKEMEDIIARRSSEREIADAAKRQGILTLAQDGILKVLEGTTSLSELERVLDLSRT